MKKVRVLALTLIFALGLMGAGYAYWTDTLTINNSVSTGELNVRFVDQNVTRGGDNQVGTNDAGQRIAYWESYVKHEGLNNGPATIVSDKTVTTEVTNMYPGAYAQYYGTIENNGTIPAVFADATVSFTGKNGENLSAAEQEFKDNLKFAIGYKIVDAQGNPVAINDNSGDGRFWRSGTMAQFETGIESLFANVRLEPGERLLLDFPSEEDAIEAMASIDYPYNEEMHCITYTLSTAADNDVENQELGIHITINWQQHNAQ